MRKVMMILSVAVLCCLFVNPANSQPGMKAGPGTITGSVIDSLSKAPVIYATITVQNPKDSSIVTGAITDDKGSFSVKGLPLGEYFVKTSFIGYLNTIVNKVKITSDNKIISLGTVSLYPSGVTSQEVSVSAQKDVVSYKLDKKVVNVSQMPEAQGGSAAEALRNAPSVSVDMENNVSLRGSGNFTVLIDGRPTSLSGQDALKQIPAAAIENIEIITNPSAKYDPDGTTGIINLILKKQETGGFNGIVNGSVGTKDKYSADFLTNYRTNGNNFFIGGHYNDRKYRPNSDFTREVYYNDTTQYVKPLMDRLMNPYGYGLKAGVDYKINETHSLSLSGDWGSFSFDRIFPSKYHEWTNPGTVDKYYLNTDDFLMDGKYFSTNLIYNLKFEETGNELNTSLLFSGWDGGRTESMNKYITDALYNSTGTPMMKKNKEDQVKTYFKAKADYTKEFSEKSKLEAGFNSEGGWGDASYDFWDYDTLTSIWGLNKDLTNSLKFDYNLQALYTTFSEEFLTIQFQVGLRAEYYYRDIRQVTLQTDYKNEQFSLFPTVHLSRQFDGGHQLQMSYSKRVNRPDERLLNPFPDYTDDYHVSTGNPNLESEYTHSYELSYRKSFDNSFVSLESYYRETYNSFSRINELKSDNKLWITIINLDRDYSYGLELNGNIAFTQWLRLNANANLYNYNIETEYNNQKYKKNANTFTCYGALQIFPSQTTFIQLTGYYSGKQLQMDGEQKPVYTFGLSVKQDFFDRAFSVVLSGQDIFNTAKYEFVNQTGNYKSYGVFYPETPSFVLSLSYRINNYNQMEQPQRESINIDYNSGF